MHAWRMMRPLRNPVARLRRRRGSPHLGVWRRAWHVRRPGRRGRRGRSRPPRPRLATRTPQRARPKVALLYGDQGFPRTHGLSGFDADLGDGAGFRGADLALHLHRLEYAHWLVRGDFLPLLHEHLDDGALHRRPDSTLSRRSPTSLAPPAPRRPARGVITSEYPHPEELSVHLDLDLTDALL